MKRMQAVVLTVAGVLFLGGDALAGSRYGLRLGQPRARRGGVIAVPVVLRTEKGAEVAALNFSLRYDASRVTPTSRGVVAGPAVDEAGAHLASRDDVSGGLVRVIVVPDFRPDFPSLPGRKVRVATAYFQGRSAARGRGSAGAFRLEDVVLSDGAGRALRLASVAGGKRAR